MIKACAAAVSTANALLVQSAYQTISMALERENAPV